MNYQDLKLIWDNQTNNPLFTIDQEIVLNSVEKKCLAIKDETNLTDKTLIISSFFVGLLLIIEPLILHNNLHWPSFAIGLIYVVKGCYSFFFYKSRNLEEQSYEKAVIPSIEKALSQNQHLVKMLKRWLIFFDIPAAIICIVGLIFFSDGITLWIWALFLSIIIYSIWYTPRYMRINCRKEEKELIAIRSKFLEFHQ